MFLLNAHETYTVPKPNDPNMDRSINSSNDSYVGRPICRGNVIVNEHVDTEGKREPCSDTKFIHGVASNPVAGILLDPDRNFKMSSNVTLLPSIKKGVTLCYY